VTISRNLSLVGTNANSSGQIILTTGVTGVLPKASMPTGSVLQVVNATTSTIVFTTSATPITTSLTATITPLFSTSKILVIVSIQGVYKAAGNVATGAMLSLYKNGSVLLSNYAQYVGYTNSSVGNLVGSNSLNYQDSPATTSATTYAIFLASSVAGQQVGTNIDNDTSTITLMEIAA
jgi:hypothetical protein